MDLGLDETSYSPVQPVPESASAFECVCAVSPPPNSFQFNQPTFVVSVPNKVQTKAHLN